MITEDYISFETAKLLKEKGFNEGCSFVVNVISKGLIPVSWPTTNSDIEDEEASLITLPTLQMAMKWLREVHSIHIDICSVWNSTHWLYQVFVTTPITVNNSYVDKTEYTSYEEAVEAALKYTLENLIL